jgi:hypothetical protein
MDHEYDAQDADDDTDKTDQGMESPPNGPSAAHFREAARLAAARARKALETNADEQNQKSETQAQSLVSEDFKKAATKHARSVSGRSRNALQKKAEQAAASAAMEQDANAEESIALLEERLHLGARMLRAFESQIQRLEEAGAERAPDTQAVEIPPQVAEAVSRLEACLERADHVEKRLETLLARAEEIASGLGNGIEICNAIQSSTQERAREIAELENAQQQRGDAIIQRAQAALTVMEQTLDNAESVGDALGARTSEPAPANAVTDTLKREPPVIEIHARTPRAVDTTQAPPEDGDSIEQFSVGTLSVEPGRARKSTHTS